MTARREPGSTLQSLSSSEELSSDDWRKKNKNKNNFHLCTLTYKFQPQYGLA